MTALFLTSSKRKPSHGFVIKMFHTHLLSFATISNRAFSLLGGVSDSLLIHQFGTREKLLVEAMDAPQGLDRALNLIRHLPKGMWGRVLAEAMARGEVRNKTARENLELLVRAAAQSEVAAQMITEWVVNELTEEIRGLGINNPELRARGFATVLFGTTFSNEILSLPNLDAKQLREQVKLRGRVLQAILAD